jgi:hypothetical protein
VRSLHREPILLMMRSDMQMLDLNLIHAQSQLQLRRAFATRCPKLPKKFLPDDAIDQAVMQKMIDTK